VELTACALLLLARTPIRVSPPVIKAVIIASDISSPFFVPFRQRVCAILTPEVILMQWYFALFNAVTDAIEALERVEMLLKTAQLQAEMSFIEGED
jgi:hypothetical protein